MVYIPRIRHDLNALVSNSCEVDRFVEPHKENAVSLETNLGGSSSRKKKIEQGMPEKGRQT